MANYRQFFLTYSGTKIDSIANFKKTSYDLQNINSRAFFNNPEGLGDEREITITKNGDFARVNANQSTMQNITGELIFAKKAGGNLSGNEASYEQYKYFVSFCKRSRLSLMYVLPGADSLDNIVCREVVLTNIEKTEVDDKLGYLRCKVSFKPLSPYVIGKVNIAHTPVNSITKITDANGTAVFEITTKGNIPTPLNVSYTNEYVVSGFEYRVYTDYANRVCIGAGAFKQNQASINSGEVSMVNGRWYISERLLHGGLPDLSKRESGRPFIFLELPPNDKLTIVVKITANTLYRQEVKVWWDDYYDTY